MEVDVLIPVYRPDGKLTELLKGFGINILILDAFNKNPFISRKLRKKFPTVHQTDLLKKCQLFYLIGTRLLTEP